MLKRSWPAGRSAHRPSGGAAHAGTLCAIQTTGKGLFVRYYKYKDY